MCDATEENNSYLPSFSPLTTATRARDMSDNPEGKPARYRSQRKAPGTSNTPTTTAQTTTDAGIGRSRSRYHKTRPGAAHTQEQQAHAEATKEPAIFPTRTRSTRGSRGRDSSRDAEAGAFDSGDDGYGSMRSQQKSLEQAKADLRDDPMALARAQAPTHIRAKVVDFIPPQEEGDVSAEETAGCFGLFGRKKKKSQSRNTAEKSLNTRPATTRSTEPPVIRPGGGGIVPMTDAPLSAPNGASEMRRVSRPGRSVYA